MLSHSHLMSRYPPCSAVLRFADFNRAHVHHRSSPDGRRGVETPGAGVRRAFNVYCRLSRKPLRLTTLAFHWKTPHLEDEAMRRRNPTSLANVSEQNLTLIHDVT